METTQKICSHLLVAVVVEAAQICSLLLVAVVVEAAQICSLLLVAVATCSLLLVEAT
jgi:hypothetical protein